VGTEGRLSKCPHGPELVADSPDIPVYLTTMVGEGGYEGLSALCYEIFPGGPGWDGESECIVFEGPVPQIGGLPSE
jgi:hypothetical protein